MSNTDFAKLR